VTNLRYLLYGDKYLVMWRYMARDRSFAANGIVIWHGRKIAISESWLSAKLMAPSKAMKAWRRGGKACIA